MFIHVVLFKRLDVFFSADVCSKADNITMCPLCDKFCDYWKLSDTCVHAKITHLFDNNFTVVFAFLMSVWGKLVFLVCCTVPCCYVFVFVNAMGIKIAE